MRDLLGMVDHLYDTLKRTYIVGICLLSLAQFQLALELASQLRGFVHVYPDRPENMSGTRKCGHHVLAKFNTL